MGGLGNQMFQYAAGRAVALRHDVPLKLDITSVSGITERKYELNNFNINADCATTQEIKRMRWKKQPIWKHFTRKLLGLPQYIVDSESFHEEELSYHYDSQIFDIGPDVYLQGYWQSVKYFVEIFDVIRKELLLHVDVSNGVLRLATEISSTNAVSVHFRRGDYANNPIVSKEREPCSLDYYRMAIDVILAKAGKVHYYLFSDEPEWVEKNFQADIEMTVIPIGNSSYEDMWLMSLCKHNITANSSFSWWGAWLNSNNSKIVICPKKWFKNGRQTPDLLPSSWICIGD